MHEWEMIAFQHINSTFFLGNIGVSLYAITMALWSAHGEAAHLASANAANSLFLVFAPMIQKIRHRNRVFTGKSWRRWSAPWGRRRSTRSHGGRKRWCTVSSDCYLRRAGSCINTPFLSLLSCVSGVCWSWGEGLHEDAVSCFLTNDYIFRLNVHLFLRTVQLKGTVSSAKQTEGKKNLFYRFSALILRISLLTFASCFLIGLAIDCPPSHPLPSRWPITNKPSRKCWRSQKTQAAQGLD